MRLPIQVGAIIFQRNGNMIEYLLLKRLPERGGFWQSVTGGLEEGETLTEALLREVTEETGIKDFIRLIDPIHYFEFSDSNRLYKEYVYGVEVSNVKKIILDEKEHSEYRWCNFQGALQLLYWKEHKEAFRKLNGILISHSS